MHHGKYVTETILEHTLEGVKDPTLKQQLQKTLRPIIKKAPHDGRQVCFEQACESKKSF